MSASVVSRLFRGDALVVAGTLVLVILAFPETSRTLLGRWLRFDEAYSHGLLVLAMSLFLAGRTLRNRHYPPTVSIPGMMLAALNATGLTLAAVINIQVVQQMGLVVLWWSCVFALLGWRAARAFLVPIGILYYAIPFWDYLALPLQMLATAVNSVLLGLRGIHFEVHGVFIHLLDVGTFEIAHGCSGLRYLVVALTLATLFSAINLNRPRDWLVLHAAAVGLGLLVNWVRIFVIILVGYETEMQSGLISNHELFGWLLFLGALIPLLILANRLARRGQAAPVDDVPSRRRGHPVVATLGAVVVVSLVAVPSLYIGHASVPGEYAPLATPEALGKRQSRTAPEATLWNPEMRRTDQHLRASYDSDGELPPLNLGIWWYAPQRQGHELVQYGNRLFDPREWQVEQHREGPREGWSILVLRHRILEQSQVVATSYFVAGRWTRGELAVKAQMLRGALGGRRDGALVSFDMRCSSTDCDAAHAAVQQSLAGNAIDTVEALLNDVAPR